MPEIREAARAAAPAVKAAIEYAATENFVKLTRNILLVSMMGMMGYMLLRTFSALSPAVENAVSQVGQVFGAIIAAAIPIMVIVFVISIIKAIIRIVGGGG